MADRIDHAAEARKHIEWAHEQQSEEGRFDETVQHNATLAVAEAMLALAEQQRIANLVALEVSNRIDTGIFHAGDEEETPWGQQRRPELADDIREALGLA